MMGRQHFLFQVWRPRAPEFTSPDRLDLPDLKADPAGDFTENRMTAATCGISYGI